ncbi:unnamed protein product, partial [Mesorhabditis belari]|uniref:ZP domain-containing protein n=1 Tax=Mesorhabditis belari TaxID=2138241 RepID=A0AAF3FHM0_9BILA
MDKVTFLEKSAEQSAKNPEVSCGSDEIALNFHTKAPFKGKVFVKGYVSDSNCMRVGNQQTDQRFGISFDQCGVRRERKINGVTIAATVIVSFHQIFITKVDRAYRISCFYMESSKSVNQRIDVSSLTTQLLENQISMPTCRYEILSGGPNGRVAQYARIGEAVYHKWTCHADLPDVYCMRVHSCTVVDGQGGPSVTVLDANGCQVDESVLKNLEYIDDLSAGQEAMAFKFADRSGLYFNCQIQLTLKDRQFGCSVSQPDCSQTPYGGQIVVPASATEAESLEDFTAIDPEALEHKSGYTARPIASDTEAGLDTASTYRETKTTSAYRKNSQAQQSTSPYFAGQQQHQAHPPGVSPTDFDRIRSKFQHHAQQRRREHVHVNARINRGYETGGEVNEERFAAAKAKRHLDKDIVADFDLPQTSLVVFGLEDEEPIGDHSPPTKINEMRSHLAVTNEMACVRTS